MGMGDKKIITPPVRRRIRCVNCGNSYTETAVRRCPHPAVKALYGEVYVCQYCCARKPCEHFERDELSGATICKLARKE